MASKFLRWFRIFFVMIIFIFRRQAVNEPVVELQATNSTKFVYWSVLCMIVESLILRRLLKLFIENSH